MEKKSNFKYGKLYCCHFVVVLYTLAAYRYSLHKFTDHISMKIWVFFDMFWHNMYKQLEGMCCLNLHFRSDLEDESSTFL